MLHSLGNSDYVMLTMIRWTNKVVCQVLDGKCRMQVGDWDVVFSLVVFVVTCLRSNVHGCTAKYTTAAIWN